MSIAEVKFGCRLNSFLFAPRFVGHSGQIVPRYAIYYIWKGNIDIFFFLLDPKELTLIHPDT